MEAERKLIVSADPSLTTVIAFPAELKRDHGEARTPLSFVELETLLSQAIGKVFNERRKEASKRLGRDELDTILVNVKADHFKIDNHRVLNPAGFKGRTVGVVLELTFTTREIFENLKHFFNAKEGFFFTEAARAGLRTLSKVQDAPINLIVLNPHRSSCFMFEKTPWGHTISREDMEWRLHSIFEAIASALPVSHEIVLRLYHLYLNNETSESFRRSLGKILKAETDRLLEETKKSRLRGATYLHTPMPLPFTLPLRHGQITMNEVPIVNILDKAGFKLDFSQWPMLESELFMRLAPFFDFYYDRSNSEINHTLRRRLHWLIQ